MMYKYYLFKHVNDVGQHVYLILQIGTYKCESEVVCLLRLVVELILMNLTLQQQQQ